MQASMTSDEPFVSLHHTSTTHYIILRVHLATSQVDSPYQLILRVTLIRGTPSYKIIRVKERTYSGH